MNKKELHLSIENSVRLVFSRSGGNGGQNVNKVNTKVHAFIEINKLEGLSENEMELIKSRLSKAINAQNEIFVAVQEERTQERNRDIALKRLENIIVSATHVDPPRKATKPTKASVENRLQTKKLNSERKKSRQDGSYQDF